MEVFRTKIEARPEPVAEKPAEVTGVVADPEGVPKDANRSDTLENWELQNGKYGLEYLGIKNIANEFPMKMNFSMVDKFIKSEMAERGYDSTPKAWQDMLAEIESEIGTTKMDAISRLKKLADYVRVVSKMKKLQKQKESFILGTL